MGQAELTLSLSNLRLSAPSQLLDKHASPNIGSNTSNFNNILEHDLFLHRLSRRRKPQLRLCPGETLHRERSGLTTTCGCLFGFVHKKKPTYLERFIRRELSARAALFCGWWEYKLDWTRGGWPLEKSFKRSPLACVFFLKE